VSGLPKVATHVRSASALPTSSLLPDEQLSPDKQQTKQGVRGAAAAAAAAAAAGSSPDRVSVVLLLKICDQIMRHAPDDWVMMCWGQCNQCTESCSALWQLL
jgi:hypothetical protein